MKKSNKVSNSKMQAALALAVAVVAPAPAQAGVIDISETISLSDLLSGNSTNLHFDLASLLTSAGVSDADVLSGTLVVYGTSDLSYGAANPQPYGGYNLTGYSSHSYTYPYTYSYSYSYSCGSWGWSTCYGTGYATAYATGYATDYIYTRSRDVVFTDVTDTMTLTAGTDAASGSDSLTLHDVGNYLAPNYEYQSGGGSSPISYYYNQERDVYNATYGPLAASLTLDATALGELQGGGLLDASVAATAGQFKLMSAQLTVQANTHPSAQPSTSVPEPNTLALFGAAAAAGVVVRRRRNRVDK